MGIVGSASRLIYYTHESKTIFCGAEHRRQHDGIGIANNLTPLVMPEPILSSPATLKDRTLWFGEIELHFDCVLGH